MNLQLTRRWICFALGLLALPMPASSAEQGTRVARIIEAAGTVELRRNSATNWQTAAVNTSLSVGDQLRTGTESRAALELGDRSIIRVGERAILVMQAPRGSEERRFRLNAGRIFLFNRARPSSVEFETPLASGAIRGTEFVLDVGDAGERTDLDLVDGNVEIITPRETLQLASGQGVRLSGSSPAELVEIPIARSLPPWALHFPMVLIPAELVWESAETNRVATSLALYHQGRVQEALQNLPSDAPTPPATRVFRTALLLSTGSAAPAPVSPDTGANSAIEAAIGRLIQVMRGEPVPPLSEPASATEWLVLSWERQLHRDPEGALHAAREAARRQPSSGLTWQRVAELALGLERPAEARDALSRCRSASPDLASALVIEGHLLLEQSRLVEALASFDRAVALDPSSGGAWLGRGLTQSRLGLRDPAAASLRRAAALEPQRAGYRIALARSQAAAGDAAQAGKELRLARTFGINDPSAWLHSALFDWQQNRLNTAIRELETSVRMNDGRAVFRSDYLLDRDRAVRAANLSALYREAGFTETSLRLAARATTDAYTDFSGHQLLAGYYRDLEDPGAYDLRYETVRASEHLMASLLAPAGTANLSLVLDQQEHLRFAEPPRFGFGSRTDYRGNGDWWQRGSLFGHERGFSYALDADYRSRNGDQPNGWLEQRWLSLQSKFDLTLQDSLYFQAGWLERESGDVARYFDPNKAKRDFRATESQPAALVVGYRRVWNPQHQSLLLATYHDDQFASFDNQAIVPFLLQSGGVITSVITPDILAQDFNSRFRLAGGELQHIWQPVRHTVIAGARAQGGRVDSGAVLQSPLPPPIAEQRFEESFWRTDVYLYDQWHWLDSLSLIAGLTYSHLDFPLNADNPPLAAGTDRRDLLGPKLGMIWRPWRDGLLRAMYSRSLGGLYLDNSLRLEPTQVAGLNQAFRSLIPESTAGLLPGAEMDVVSLAFDQATPGGLFFGTGWDWRRSEGDRRVGAVTYTVIPTIPESTIQTLQSLRFEETEVSAHAGWLLGEQFSVSARYRLSHARLDSRFPEIPDSATGLDQLEMDVESFLHHAQVGARWQHPAGWFVNWSSDWYQQSNLGYGVDLPGDDFWQHSVVTGYRLPGRKLEVHVGVLNLLDRNYRLAPLNYITEPPRGRTFVAGLRLNF